MTNHFKPTAHMILYAFHTDIYCAVVYCDKVTYLSNTTIFL